MTIFAEPVVSPVLSGLLSQTTTSDVFSRESLSVIHAGFALNEWRSVSGLLSFPAGFGEAVFIARKSPLKKGADLFFQRTGCQSDCLITRLFDQGTDMARADLADITFVLDRSGSMQSIRSATIEAYNQFVHSQCRGTGRARMTLVQFDDEYQPVYQGLRIQDVPVLDEQTYEPRGATALLDAMGRTIVRISQRLNQLAENDRPATVVFVTLTDGYENSSREFSLPRINELIREQREKYGWQFIFLGANQDAIATAAKVGVAAGQAMTFSATPGGVSGCCNSLSEKLHRVRSAKAQGDAQAKVEFDENDRNAARGSNDSTRDQGTD